jgi:hypothetical protein
VAAGTSANTPRAASASSQSCSTLTRRIPVRAPLASQASPIPDPVPVSPMTPVPIPPARELEQSSVRRQARQPEIRLPGCLDSQLDQQRQVR